LRKLIGLLDSRKGKCGATSTSPQARQGRYAMSEQHKVLVRRLLQEDISKADTAVAAEIIHPGFHDHTNPPGMQHGLEGHNAIVALFHGAFPDMWWHIHEMIAEGDKVVARTTMEATHTGDFFGIPPTGKHVLLDGIHILRIA